MAYVFLMVHSLDVSWLLPDRHAVGTERDFYKYGKNTIVQVTSGR